MAGVAAQRRISVRLVKGAYWDGEIKRAQQLGMPDYPVFTRKAATDLSYVACARRLLSAPERIYPAFATHNCRTVATILELAGEREFEFQKLFGMGDALYDALLAEHPDVACRIYAPVGGFTDLLPYLVRRLLENGANTSFVHQIADPGVPLETLVADPLAALPEPYQPDPRIPLPRELYPDRAQFAGPGPCRAATSSSELQAQTAAPSAPLTPVEDTSPQELDFSIARAADAFESWSQARAERARRVARARRRPAGSAHGRAGVAHRARGRPHLRRRGGRGARGRRFLPLLRFAGKKPFPPAQAACRVPPANATSSRLHGRGVFACISPWNFPLAIFTGQVAAALAAGNTVIAKPAEQTPRIGFRALEILYEAGIPPDAACCVVGPGETHRRRAGRRPAHRRRGLHRLGRNRAGASTNALAKRDGPIVPLIAETGGVNAMIVDASALPEQVVDDVVVSAFQSAGQRCSAQRILFVDEGCASARDATPRRRARRAQGRRSRRARHRHRAGHRRAGTRCVDAAHRKTEGNCKADRRSRGTGQRQLRRADRLPAAARSIAAHRSVRARAACLHLPPPGARAGAALAARHRLRPDARHPLAASRASSTKSWPPRASATSTSTAA